MARSLAHSRARLAAVRREAISRARLADENSLACESHATLVRLGSFRLLWVGNWALPLGTGCGSTRGGSYTSHLPEPHRN